MYYPWIGNHMWRIHLSHFFWPQVKGQGQIDVVNFKCHMVCSMPYSLHTRRQLGSIAPWSLQSRSPWPLTSDLLVKVHVSNVNSMENIIGYFSGTNKGIAFIFTSIKEVMMSSLSVSSIWPWPHFQGHRAILVFSINDITIKYEKSAGQQSVWPMGP